MRQRQALSMAKPIARQTQLEPVAPQLNDHHPMTQRDRIINHQQRHGNAATGRLIQRDPLGATAVAAPAADVMIGHAGKAASGDDFTSYADYLLPEQNGQHRVTPGEAFRDMPFFDQVLVSSLITKSDIELMLIMMNELNILAGALGREMTMHFYNGSGSMYTHGIGSELSNLAGASSTFNTEATRIQGEIENNLRGQIAQGGSPSLNQMKISPNRPSFQFSDGWALKGIIGGTQEVMIYAHNLQYNPTTRAYSVDLRWELLDDFGAGHDDPYSPSLAAFWLLQHTRAGHRPFVNKLVINRTLSGTL